MIGSSLSHYLIREKIGEGGMGLVYKAHDTRLSRLVAIKILPPHLITDEKNLRRFIHEAQTASALNHPNICTIHDTDESGGIRFIVMEFVEGETLREILQRRGRLPEAEVLDIGLKVASALQAAHAKAIIHRDIKPENLMISREGYVKVMDFGLAKLKIEEPESITHLPPAFSISSVHTYRTSVSSFLGTSSYMSPEQIERKLVDERTDIFSIGVVLYEMLTGMPPFVGRDNLAVMKSILTENPKPPSDFIGVKATKLEATILKALAKDPAARHGNVAEFRHELAKTQTSYERGSIRQRLIRIATVLVLIASATIWGILKVFETPDISPPPSLKMHSLGLGTSAVESAAFSPDGNRIIYSSGGNSTTRGNGLSIKDLRNGDEKLLVSALGEIGDWSPDGAKIVCADIGNGIFITDTSGANVARITDFGYYPKWSPNGRQIAFCTRSPFDIAAENAIFLYSLEDSSLRQISPKNGVKFGYPDWSPDGRWIICCGGEGSRREMWLIDLATGKSQQISEYGAWLTCPIWCPSGGFIYFLSNKYGPRDIWRVPIDMHAGELLGKPVQITTGLQVNNMDISANGNKLIFNLNQGGPNSKLWQIPLSKKIADPVQQAKLIRTNFVGADNIEISPDGTKLVLEASIGGLQLLLVKSFVEDDETVIYRARQAYAPSWSADGKWIAFDAGGGNKADIYRVPAAGGEEEKLIASPKADWLPTYAPDGKRICCVSNRSGFFDLWVQDLTTGETTNVTNSENKESRGCWSHNSEKLAYVRSSIDEKTASIWIYDFSTKKAEQLVQVPESGPVVLTKVVWKYDDSALYVSDGGGGAFWEASTANKKVRKVFEQTTRLLVLHAYAFTILNDIGYFVSNENVSDLWIAEGLK